MGYNPSILSLKLNGKSPITDKDIISFCKYLKCSPNDIIPITNVQSKQDKKIPP